MQNLLFDNYLTVFGAFAILLLLSGASGAVFWGMRRRWQRKLSALERVLVDARSEYTSMHYLELHNYLQSAVAHEFVGGLDFIKVKSQETREVLKREQIELCEKQSLIIAKADELIQHAINVLDLYAPRQGQPQQVLLRIRQLVEDVLLQSCPYAESKGVELMPSLNDVEPVPLSRELTQQAIKNVVHNAIKYSHRGHVVKVTLLLKESEMEEETDKFICIEVMDTGKGIKKEDYDKIFELRKRGDGLIELGSGIGLYCAREAARRQGGDVILVDSKINEGSTFRIILPYGIGQPLERA